MAEFWQGRNVFITGADGFIASWIAKELVEKKTNVVAIVRDLKAESNLKLLNLEPKLTVVQGDIVDLSVLERIFNEYGIDTCFHLAAQPIVSVANRSPLSTFDSNIKGTWNILEACRNSQTLEQLVVASSDKAYGTQKQLPYTEDQALNPEYPYDVSKACAEMLARSYYLTYGLPVAITRCANIYGGGDMNFSRIIPDTARSVLEGKPPVIRSDGSPERDYMYVKDAVNAYLVLGESVKEKNGVKGEVFNFGTETPIKVIDLVEKIIALSGQTHLKPVVQGKGKLSGEIERQYLSSEKAKRVLGWKASYLLDDGLKETIHWYANYFKSLSV